MARCNVAVGMVAAVLTAFVGCGDSGGATRFDVSGAVTFNGQPVPDATIQFDPDPAANNAGPQGFAKVVEGRFNTAESGRGAVGGPHIVRIEGAMGPDPARKGNWLYINHRMTLDLPQDATETNIELPAEAVKSAPKIPEV